MPTTESCSRAEGTGLIVLTVVRGSNEGRQFHLEGTGAWLVGRASDCDIRLPSDPAHLMVSRRHCLLQAGECGSCVRDLGSLNGTFINDTSIGRREPGEATIPERGGHHPLYDGDELRVGDTIFRVEIVRGAVCDPAACPAARA